MNGWTLRAEQAIRLLLTIHEMCAADVIRNALPSIPVADRQSFANRVFEIQREEAS